MLGWRTPWHDWEGRRQRLPFGDAEDSINTAVPNYHPHRNPLLRNPPPPLCWAVLLAPLLRNPPHLSAGQLHWPRCSKTDLPPSPRRQRQGGSRRRAAVASGSLWRGGRRRRGAAASGGLWRGCEGPTEALDTGMLESQVDPARSSRSTRPCGGYSVIQTQSK